MSTATELQEADPANPMTRRFTWIEYVPFAVWSALQPVLRSILRYPVWLALVFWFVGLTLAVGARYANRYVQAAPYRRIVAAARLANPGSAIFGVRLDPLTTPVGVEWGDSRVIGWGLLRASLHGVEITKSDGGIMMDRPWSELEGTVQGFDVRAGGLTEEWWFRFISEAGIRYRSPFVRRRARFLLIEALRPAAPTAGMSLIAED